MTLKEALEDLDPDVTMGVLQHTIDYLKEVSLNMKKIGDAYKKDYVITQSSVIISFHTLGESKIISLVGSRHSLEKNLESIQKTMTSGEVHG